MGTSSAAAIRVLHVDDEPGFAQMAAVHLERQDDHLAVETATMVGEALERLRDSHIHCVVSDYDMPGQNGVEFLEAVRVSSPTYRLSSTRGRAPRRSPVTASPPG